MADSVNADACRRVADGCLQVPTPPEAHLLKLPRDAFGECYSFLNCEEQVALRSTCTYAVSAFDVAVRNEYCIASAATDQAGVTSVRDHSVRWVPFKRSPKILCGWPAVIVASGALLASGGVLQLDECYIGRCEEILFVGGRGVTALSGKLWYSHPDVPHVFRLSFVKFDGFADVATIGDSICARVASVDYGDMPKLKFAGDYFCGTDEVHGLPYRNR